ncbi:MAG: carbamoyl phosphate synthase small subunit [Bacillota bacterium]|nr:carbamoyl phosphate synthase small subunit [Bacillota bacterium]
MNRYLILENGSIFKGKAFGADKEVIAEIVFTTAMTGYIETLTDKSYTGQAVVQTFPLIGNYGVISEDTESEKPRVSAYVVREWCEFPSNFRCEKTLDAYLKENDITGLYGIDTRALTKILREHGTMNGIITDNPKVDLDKIKSYRICEPVAEVSTKEAFLVKSEKSRYTVAMLDFGKKDNILKSLLKRDCDVWVLPYNTSPEIVMKYKPDGIFLTNGPGDPSDNKEVIENLKKLSDEKIPTMGICLGHQLLALAHGFSTSKLKYGHRGANQPVKNLKTGNVYISSQNHGYAVVSESIDEKIADELFININDRTNEGLSYKNNLAFSVQFHPEACPGPKDTNFLFDDFINLMGHSR